MSTDGRAYLRHARRVRKYQRAGRLWIGHVVASALKVINVKPGGKMGDVFKNVNVRKYR